MSTVQTRPSAQAARPILASTLLEAAKAKERARNVTPVDAAVRAQNAQTVSQEILRTGFPGVDEEALSGGIRFGRDGIVGIAAEETRVGLELAYSTLTSHVLDHPSSNAFYIDTSKTFDPRRLEKCIQARLNSQGADFIHGGGYVYRKAGKSMGEEAQVDEPASRRDEIRTAMDRISMMRVFDFDGLLEAVYEVKALLRDATAHTQPTTSTDHDTWPRQHASGEVADSQAASQASVLADEEILMDLPAPDPTTDLQPPTDVAQAPTPPVRGPFLVIIPSAARIISPLMHSNHVRAHALMVHLMRSLRLLTTTYQLSIVIINSTVEQKPKDGSVEDRFLGAFASNANIKPALGKTWDWFLDVSCMITSQFKRTDRGIDEGQHSINGQLFEVIHDRHGCRAERWATLDV